MIPTGSAALAQSGNRFSPTNGLIGPEIMPSLVGSEMCIRDRVDFETARRLFTLICVLHWKG